MTIQEKANRLKFIKNNLEITLHLTEVINSIFKDDYLKEILVLKGGTATQLYLENFQRLFLDLDIDITLDITERQKFRQYLTNHLKQIGYNEINTRKSKFTYSLDSYRFPYYLENGNLNYLTLDINYTCSPHLYPITKLNIANDDFNLYQTVSLVKLEELIGMKLKALHERGAIKDLFDIYQILSNGIPLDLNKVKSAYFFYMVLGECTGNLENTSKITNITANDALKYLYPIIKKDSMPNLDQMKKEVLFLKEECSILNNNHYQYITNFKRGYNTPELLFEDDQTIENALNNPIAKYKTKLNKKNNKILI